MTTQTPKLRFPEFSELESSYKKHYFKDIFIFSTGKNIKQNEASPEFETPCVRYGELYHMYSEVISEVVNKTNLAKSELLFSDGDEILLPSAGEDPLDIGSASALTVANVAIGRTINVLKPQKSGIYSQIYVSYYINQKLRKQISTLAKGVSISNVYNSDLKTLEIILPQLPEQTKIANFLTAIDEKIQALKQKKTLLEQYKKGIMQQIFSQELRFKNDDGSDFPDWEEKNLGEICKITIGEFVIRTKQNPNGKYPVFNGGKTYTGLYDEFNNEGNKIIISARGANAGFVNFQSEKYWAGNSCYSISVKDEKIHSIKYFFFYVKMFENRFLENQQAANIPSVSKKDAEMFEIGIPSLPEQQKIANFLTAIDEKIEKVSQQITATETYKKGLLQQMFC